MGGLHRPAPQLSLRPAPQLSRAAPHVAVTRVAHVCRCCLRRPPQRCLAGCRMNLAYVHLVEPRADDLPVGVAQDDVSARPDSLLPFRQAYSGTLVTAGGYKGGSAAKAVQSGAAGGRHCHAPLCYCRCVAGVPAGLLSSAVRVPLLSECPLPASACSPACRPPRCRRFRQVIRKPLRKDR